MAEFAKLKLGLNRRKAAIYAIEMRFSQPDSDADVRLGKSEQITVEIEIPAKITNPEDYGKTLAGSPFANAEVLATFALAHASAKALKTPLRMRLLIGPSTPELINLYWETLCDSKDGLPLFTGNLTGIPVYRTPPAPYPTPSP